MPLHHPLFPLMALPQTLNNARNLSSPLIRRMGKSSLGLQHFFNLSLAHPSLSELKGELKKIIITGSLWLAPPIGDGGLNQSLIDLPSIIIEIRTGIEFRLERHRPIRYPGDGVQRQS